MKTSRIIVYGVLLVGGLCVLAVTRHRPPEQMEPADGVPWVPMRSLKPLTPPFVVDKLGILADLRASRFDALESRLTGYQKKAEAEIAEEANVRLAFQAFENCDPALAGFLSEWVKRSPKSYSAHLAQGVYLFSQGGSARGSKFASETGAGKLSGNECSLRPSGGRGQPGPRLESEARRSLRRTDGTGARARRYRSVLATREPGARRSSGELQHPTGGHELPRSKWGGSIAALDAFAGESAKHASENPRLALFNGFPDFEQGIQIDMPKGDYAAAVRSITKATDKGGDHPRFYSGRGDAFSALGRHEDAIADFKRAYELWPQSALNLVKIAGEQALLSRYPEALQTLNLATEIGGPTDDAQQLRTWLIQRMPQGGNAQTVEGD